MRGSIPKQCQQAARRPHTVTVKETVQSSSGLWEGGQAWLRAGMVSEGWQKEAIVCLHSLPQGHESLLLPTSEAKSPAVQDNTVKWGKSLPVALSEDTGTYYKLQTASHQCCGARIKCLFKQHQADFRKALTVQQHIQSGVWSRERKDLKLRHHHVQKTHQWELRLICVLWRELGMEFSTKGVSYTPFILPLKDWKNAIKVMSTNLWLSPGRSLNPRGG